MLPIYIVMTILFKKSDLALLKEKYDRDWDKVFKGNVWLVFYIIASFALLIILALWKKDDVASVFSPVPNYKNAIII